MAGKRKGRTGLEWLLEKGPPEKAEENGSDGAAAPAAPDAEAAPDVDGALAMLDLPPAAPASTVLSKAPAASSLGLGADTEEPRSDSPNKRTLDPIANALALEETPKPAASNGHAGELAAATTAKSPAAHTAEDLVDAKTAKSPAARQPEDKDGVEAKGATKIEEDVEGDEPSLPPAASESQAVVAHRKAISSGRSTRAFPRANVPFEVRFKKGSDATTGTGRNVSAGGFFVETNKLLPEGEVFQAQLVFAKRDRKLSVIAEVMWATAGDPENLERFPPGMGCKFLDVDDRDIPFIQSLVDAALSAG